MNKTLKFTPNLAHLILKGAKTNTWRLFDDKDLQSGDTVDFINSETGEKFACAILTEVEQKSFLELTERDWLGQPKYNTEQDMYEYFSSLYKQGVTPRTLLKIIWFELIP